MKKDTSRERNRREENRGTRASREQQPRGDERYPGTPFRLGHCRELLGEILEKPATPADLIIGRFFAKRRYLGSHDRGYIADAVYGVLRGVLRLRFILGAKYSGSGGEREGGALLLAYLLERREPLQESIAGEALGLGRGDVEDIGRKMTAASERIDALEEPVRTSIRHALPVWFTQRVLEQNGADEGEAILASLGEQAPITLRANRLVADREKLAAALESRGIATIPGIYSPDALLLGKRMNANAIPEFKLGWFELQDEGSQLLSMLLDPRPNWTVFDACAGAGGKALHMAAIMRGRGSITAHDINDRRLMEIRPRLRRSGVQNVRVMNHEEYLDRRRNLSGTFNAVMIDAPCSGAGVLRRTPGARLTFEEEMVDRLIVQQREIIDEYSPLVKPGGLLLYATCSLLREEDEAQVERFLADNPAWSLERPPVPDDFITPEGYFRSFPHRHGTDAFFGALLRRAPSTPS